MTHKGILSSLMFSSNILHSTLPALFAGEQPPMTLQVALMGCDCVVLAGDRLGMSLSTNNSAVDTASLCSKVDTGKQFVCTAAGDDCARRIGKNLADSVLKSGVIFSDSSAFIKAVNDLLDEHKIDWFCKMQPRKLIWGQTDGKDLVIWSATYDNDMFVLAENENWIVAGHQGNPARYWIDHYYRQNEGKKKSKDGLKKLAAHMILTGGILNPAGVEGLEMVVGTASEGFKKIKPSEIDDLRKISEGIHEGNTKLFQ